MILIIPPKETPKEAKAALPSARMRFARSVFNTVNGPPRITTYFAYPIVRANVSSVAPQRKRMGRAIRKKTTENIHAHISPPQKETEAICFARNGCFFPNALAMALAPPTPNRLEMAVSITNEGAAMVMAAV